MYSDCGFYVSEADGLLFLLKHLHGLVEFALLILSYRCDNIITIMYKRQGFYESDTAAAAL